MNYTECVMMCIKAPIAHIRAFIDPIQDLTSALYEFVIALLSLLAMILVSFTAPISAAILLPLHNKSERDHEAKVKKLMDTLFDHKTKNICERYP